MSRDVCEGVRSSFDYSRARLAQELLRSRLRLGGLEDLRRVRVFVGVDAAYWYAGDVQYGVGVAVAVDRQLELVGCRYVVRPVCIPYVPGFLAFREMEVLAPALLRARREGLLGGGTAVLVVDGHGIAHPRGLGIASHLGVAFGLPSVGVAKGLLVGRVGPCELGECIFVGDMAVGVVLRAGRRELYVSPGNVLTLAQSLELARGLLRPGTPLPVPLLLADRVSKSLRGSFKAAPGRAGPEGRCEEEALRVLRAVR